MNATDKSGPTPGRWIARKGAHGEAERWCVVTDGPVNYFIAIVENGAPGDFMETEGSNARVMAAAPDFYAACTPDRLAALHGLITYVSATHPDEIVRAALLADGRELLAGLRAAMGRVDGEGMKP